MNVSQTSPPQPGAPPTKPPHKPDFTRGVLLIFLLVIGPIITLIGHIINNPLDVSLMLDLIVYTVAILSESIFEEVRAKGLHHIKRLFAKVPDVLAWLFKQFLKPAVAYAILAILLVTFSTYSFLITPETHASACTQTPLRSLCGDGIGPIQITINDDGQLAKNGSLINIGIIDEKAGCTQNRYSADTYTPFDQFNATNETEKNLVNRILKENCEQADTTDHFTLILATTLSRTVPDNGFSISVGLEELRGAYLAQRDYNLNPLNNVKLRLLVANLGTKGAAQVATPLVAAQIVLYAKNSSGNDHFMGAVGFPFSITAKNALERLQPNGVQIVASSPSSEDLSKESGFYRIEPSDKQQNTAIRSFILKILQPQNTTPKKVMVLYDERDLKHNGDPYSHSLGENVIGSLSNTPNVTINPQPYDVGKPNTIKIQPILDFKPDLLYFAGYSDDLNALKEMLKREERKEGQNPKLSPKERQNFQLLPHMRIMGAQALYELGGYTNDNYSHLFFTSFAFPDIKSKKAPINFSKEYSGTFDPKNERPGEYGYQRAGPHSAFSYDAVTAFTTAVRHAQEAAGNPDIPSVDDIKSQLTRWPVYGVTGSTSFDGSNPDTPSDPTDKPLYLVCTDKDGHTQEVATYDQGKLLPNNPNIGICT